MHGDRRVVWAVPGPVAPACARCGRKRGRVMPAAAGRLDPSRHPWLARGIPLAWGFAEATLFFVLPEMWITWVALHGLRQGMAAAAWVLAGALAGGIAVQLAAHWNQMAVLALMERIPGIDAPLIMRAYDQ